MKLAYEVHLPLNSIGEKLAPIILIHGLFESRQTWKMTAPHIADYTARKVYAVDVRNHGESSWGTELDCKVMTEDIAEFLSQHSISKAILIGHSFGGRVAMSFALRWPEKVEMLILEDMYTKKFKAAPNGVVAQILGIVKDSLSIIPDDADLISAKECIRQYFIDMLPNNVINKTKEKLCTADVIPLKQNGSTISWSADVDRIIDLISTEKIEHDLSGVYEGETLFLCGSFSFYNIYEDRRIFELFPKAVLRNINGASHFIHLECPREFVNKVVEFINEKTLYQAKI